MAQDANDNEIDPGNGVDDVIDSFNRDTSDNAPSRMTQWRNNLPEGDPRKPRKAYNKSGKPRKAYNKSENYFSPAKLDAIENNLARCHELAPSSGDITKAILAGDLSWIKKAPGKAAFLKSYPTPADVANAIEQYFISYDMTADNKIPTMSGLALWLGFRDRADLQDKCSVIKSMDKDSLDMKYIDPIRKAVAYIESIHESNMVKTGNHSGSIFWLKNRGWTDIPAKVDGNRGNTINIIISNKGTDKGLKAALSSITAESEIIDITPNKEKDSD